MRIDLHLSKIGIQSILAETAMQIFYDKDCDLSIIQSKKVEIKKKRTQGHAHALNLKESGVDITVGLLAG